MNNPYSTTKKISNEDLKVSVCDPSQLLAEFFDGVIIKVDKEYIHES